ncbi:hypothetical protein K438DRAFT_1782188 [Mycena galopus ATCC 62051]|nr:hypothetical protein K438DRAFT_1782188 [Mycena galopus ATCC 62051]
MDEKNWQTTKTNPHSVCSFCDAAISAESQQSTKQPVKFDSSVGQMRVMFEVEKHVSTALSKPRMSVEMLVNGKGKRQKARIHSLRTERKVQSKVLPRPGIFNAAKEATAHTGSRPRARAGYTCGVRMGRDARPPKSGTLVDMRRAAKGPSRRIVVRGVGSGRGRGGNTVPTCVRVEDVLVGWASQSTRFSRAAR